VSDETLYEALLARQSSVEPEFCKALYGGRRQRYMTLPESGALDHTLRDSAVLVGRGAKVPKRKITAADLGLWW